MKFIFSILLVVFIMLLSIGCKTAKTTTETVYKDSIVEKTVYVPKEKIVYIDGEQVTIYDTLPCPDYEATDTSKTGKLTATVRIKNGKLTATCKQDSLQKRITWLEAELTKEKYSLKTTTKTVYVPVDVPKPFIPKWVKWCIAISLLLNVWFLRWDIFSLIKKLLPNG